MVVSSGPPVVVSSGTPVVVSSGLPAEVEDGCGLFTMVSSALSNAD